MEALDAKNQEHEKIAEHLANALHLADRCRQTIGECLRDGFETHTKHDKSFVTSADIKTEQVFREEVAKLYPGVGVLGEEQGLSNSDSELRWIIDPIDGTSELVAGLPHYGTVIALYHQKTALVGVFDHPSLDLRVYAGRGMGAFCNGNPMTLSAESGTHDPAKLRVALAPLENFLIESDESEVFDRVTHSFPCHRVYYSCYSMTTAAQGAFDAVFEWNLRLWDFSALPVIIEEAGGVFQLLRTYQDTKGEQRYCFVAGKADACEQISDLFKG